MKQYDKNTECSKCGERGASSKYVEEDTYLLKVEHIQRCCQNCGFRWSEAPVNKE